MCETLNKLKQKNLLDWFVISLELWLALHLERLSLTLMVSYSTLTGLLLDDELFRISVLFARTLNLVSVLWSLSAWLYRLNSKPWTACINFLVHVVTVHFYSFAVENKYLWVFVLSGCSTYPLLDELIHRRLAVLKNISLIS